jgi:hypothetical protein
VVHNTSTLGAVFMGNLWHAVTLKWLPIVFLHLIQSQCTVTATAKYSTAKVWLQHSYEFSVFLPFPLVQNMLYIPTDFMMNLGNFCMGGFMESFFDVTI